MFDYQKPIADRVRRGRLPLGFDLYNKADVNSLLPTINATSYLCPGRAGHTLIFEVSEDEQNRQSDSDAD